jgi:hypothetical protein
METTPVGAAVLALAVGTQFPDLVDKPLAWYLGVLPSGRSLGHSIFTTIILLAVVHWVATRYQRRELSIAFAVGQLSHLAADSVYPLFEGDWTAVGFVLWPVLSQQGADTDKTILEVLIESSLSLTGLVELLLVIVATALWVSHRAPGLWLCLRPIRSVVRKP